ncbi:MAG: hypothetical protein A2161_04545 [Candidatus Schekmanbacteria bacterium RBG_13_48_7]|uniref:Putative pre-16S rRNA nuclease n=1 Tax=Candidatus Schekmanbacteria bacterium RBG_13_48_7 TaxID=1817878 RepID=A0A1F7RTX1_9BACT|nr:MAG: hypothetical protein A2161_04545 [Candidatus Schekmanbacteria bacterium RBG_13_48_7]
MSKILAVDFGLKRIGLAISDETQTIAFPLKILKIQNNKEGIRMITDIVNKESISKTIVGLPLNMDGSEGFACESVREFVKLLQKTILIPVECFDERVTTLFAEKSLLECDLSRQKRKQKTDKIAAAILLQNYLDLQNLKNTQKL